MFRRKCERKNAEIAYWLNIDYRGRGIMPKAIEVFVENLFLNNELHRIWARPFEQNKASAGTLEKAGFCYEGLLRQSVYKNGKFLNSSVYALKTKCPNIEYVIKL